MTSFRNSLLFRQIEAPAETLHTPGRVKNALLPGEERMAIWTDIDLQHRLGTHCFKAISTGTAYRGLDVIWMYSFFHGSNSQVNSTVMAARMIVHGWHNSVKRSGRLPNHRLRIFLILSHYNTFWGALMPGLPFCCEKVCISDWQRIYFVLPSMTSIL